MSKAEFFLGGEPAAIQLEDMDYDKGIPALGYSNIGTLIIDHLHKGAVSEPMFCLSCQEAWIGPAKRLSEIDLPWYMAMAVWPNGRIWGYVCKDCGESKKRDEILAILVTQLGGVMTESVTLVGGTA